MLNRNTGYIAQSIQEVIDEANPGDRILVGNGVYEEDIIIDKPLTLQAANDEQAIIHPSGTIGIEILADNVTIQGMQILGNVTYTSAAIIEMLQYGIYVDQSDAGGYDNITLRNNHVENASYSGIYFGNDCAGGGYGGSATIEGNTVLNSGEHGIRVHTHGDSTGHVIIIRDNHVEGSGEMGIRVFAACGGSGIESVTITGNTLVENNGQAIRVQATEDASIGLVRIENNDIIGIEESSFMMKTLSTEDVHVQGDGKCSDEMSIAGRGDAATGIHVQAGRDNSYIGEVMIRGNEIANGGQGIRVHSGYGSEYVDGQTVYHSGDIESVIIDQNAIRDTGCHGIWVNIHGDGDGSTDQAVVTVTSNTVERSGSRGISVQAAQGMIFTTVTIEGNTVIQSNMDNDCSGDDDCGAEGIRVHVGRYAAINNLHVNDNVVTDGLGGGIRIHAGGNGYGSIIGYVEVEGNVIEGNIGKGLRLSTCKSTSNEGLPGIVEEAMIRDNDIAGNSHGVYIYAGTNCYGSEYRNGGELYNITIEQNTITENGVGIYLEANYNGLIDGVTISNNTLSGNIEDLTLVEDTGGEIKDPISDITL